MKRESFKSRLGFLLVSAGCAIGIGNVWRFPYVTGQNGGGIFVLFYLIFLVIMGLPVLTMELAVGRASRKSAVLGYKALEKKGSKWHIHGWVAIFGCCMLMMYYTTVSGWMVTYFFKFLTGSFKSGMTTEDTAQAFSNLLGDPKQMAFWMILTVVVGFIVCSRGCKILSCSKYRGCCSCRIKKCDYSSDESVIFYAKSWRGSNGNFWKLYGKGSHISRRGCTNLCT